MLTLSMECHGAMDENFFILLKFENRIKFINFTKHYKSHQPLQTIPGMSWKNFFTHYDLWTWVLYQISYRLTQHDEELLVSRELVQKCPHIIAAATEERTKHQPVNHGAVNLQL